MEKLTNRSSREVKYFWINQYSYIPAVWSILLQTSNYWSCSHFPSLFSLFSLCQYFYSTKESLNLAMRKNLSTIEKLPRLNWHTEIFFYRRAETFIWYFSRVLIKYPKLQSFEKIFYSVQNWTLSFVSKIIDFGWKKRISKP